MDEPRLPAPDLEPGDPPTLLGWVARYRLQAGASERELASAYRIGVTELRAHLGYRRAFTVPGVNLIGVPLRPTARALPLN